MLYAVVFAFQSEQEAQDFAEDYDMDLVPQVTPVLEASKTIQ
jgi:hypothetical protein